MSGEVRSLRNGDEPFPDTTTFGRVYALVPGSQESDYDYEGRPDSTATLRIPSPDIDNDELFDARVWAGSGVRPMVLIADADDLPPDVLSDLVRASAIAMAPTPPDRTFDEVEEIARDIRNVEYQILDRRIRDVEQTVRDALADDHLTEEDYAALRKYPERLAKVERLAVAIRNPEPEWESLIPEATDIIARINYTPTLDMFHKWATETEADAKQAVSRISGLVATQQVAMGQRQRLDVERLQRTVTVVGAAVLVPGMVAAVFGANLDVPGEETRRGFWAMLMLMTAGGVGSFAALKAVELRVNLAGAGRRPRRCRDRGGAVAHRGGCPAGFQLAPYIYFGREADPFRGHRHRRAA